MFYTHALQIGLLLVCVNNLLSSIGFRAYFDSQFHTALEYTTPEDSTHVQAKLPLTEGVESLRRHVAIATAFKYHAEVYGPFAWTATKILKNQTRPSSVHIYDEETEFVSLMKRLGQLPANVLRPPEKERFIADMQSTSLFPDDVGAMIDLVFLVTCEIDLVQLGPELLRVWDKRPRDKKFMLVCGVHNGADAFWAHEHLTDWAKRGTLSLLTISDHVSDFFKRRLSEWADSKDPAERLSFYEYVKINT
ncbi:hypothetical protein FRC01_012735, partial [Tulasnella sp. 417]